MHDRKIDSIAAGSQARTQPTLHSDFSASRLVIQIAMTPSTSRTPAEGSPALQQSREEKHEPPSVAKGTRRDVSEQAAAATTRDQEVVSLVHDVRTPLTIIMLEAQMIRRRLEGSASEPVLRGLARIEENAAYIDRLVADLVDLSSLDAGHFVLRLECVDLARLVGEAVELISTSGRARVTIELHDLLHVQGDPARLQRVVVNLVGNALKFSVGGHVTVRLEGHEINARVSVIDDGPGLTMEEAARVFDLHDSGEPGPRGHGMALHICQRIVDAHGGRIGVNSAPGKGSQFYFELVTVSGPADSDQRGRSGTSRDRSR